MKIAFTGTSGIGKTTIAKALADRYSLRLVGEEIDKLAYAIDVLKKTPRDKTKELNKSIERFLKSLDDWLSDRMKYFESDLCFIEDRFCIDAINFLASSGIGKFGDDLVKDLVVKCAQYSTIYDLVVVPPIQDFTTFQYRNHDGLYRNNTLASKIIQQSAYIGLLEQFCAAPRLYLTPNLKTIDQQIEAIEQVLKQKATNNNE